EVELVVRPGEVVCVLGVNGAGKTTLLSAIAGMIEPVRGSIVLGERNIVGPRPEEVVRMGAALVPEGRQVFPTMSVRDNLALGGYRAKRVGGPSRAEMLEEIHQLFPVLERSAGRAAGSLSGGEQQMLAIGRALMARPTLLMVGDHAWTAVKDYRSPYLFAVVPGEPTPPLTDHVVLVIVDGLRNDVAHTLPVFQRVGREGSFLTARTGLPSLSLPGWTFLTTGA